jgi:hypothetical protein
MQHGRDTSTVKLRNSLEQLVLNKSSNLSKRFRSMMKEKKSLALPTADDEYDEDDVDEDDDDAILGLKP